jgi:hypothetical protein
MEEIEEERKSDIGDEEQPLLEEEIPLIEEEPSIIEAQPTVQVETLPIIPPPGVRLMGQPPQMPTLETVRLLQ